MRPESRPESYVGLTGFENAAQVTTLRGVLPKDRLLMVGCVMRGNPNTWAPDKWPNRCPRPKELRSIFGPHHNVLNMLHFTPPAKGTLYEHLCRAKEMAGVHLHGFQINIPWPNVEAIARYKTQHPDAVITFALREQVIASVARNIELLAERMKPYQGIIDYVIMDTSEGRAQPLDVMFTARCFGKLSAVLPDVGFVAAGGLCADNVKEKLRYLWRFPLSTDAEGKLRTADDHLDLDAAIRYVKAADALLCWCEAERRAA